MPYRKKTREERREEVDALCEKLVDGLCELRSSKTYKDYLRAMALFPAYSTRNLLLITMQKPDATIVAGYSVWKKLHRQVRKGEKGIRILAPCVYPARRNVPVMDDRTGLYERDAAGNVRMEDRKFVLGGFRAVSVFDLSQTDGEPLPEIVRPLQGSVTDYEKLRDAIIRASGATVRVAEEGELGEGVNGYSDSLRREICVRGGMSEEQTVKTLLHETAHYLLHPADCPYPRNVREVQAESIAFVVGSHFGIDTSDYTLGYVDGWLEGADDSELREQLDVIGRTADTLIGRVEHELGIERSVTLGGQPRGDDRAAGREKKQCETERQEPGEAQKMPEALRSTVRRDTER